MYNKNGDLQQIAAGLRLYIGLSHNQMEWNLPRRIAVTSDYIHMINVELQLKINSTSTIVDN